MKVLKYLSFAVLLMCLASCSEENSVTLKVEAELGELANYIKLTDQEVVVNMSDREKKIVKPGDVKNALTISDLYKLIE